MRIAFFVLCLSALPGCESFEAARRELVTQQIDRQKNACTAYGFQPGTSEHATCVMRMSERRSDAIQRQNEASQAEYIQRQNELQRAMTLTPQRRTTCNSTQTMTGIQTICQ